LLVQPRYYLRKFPVQIIDSTKNTGKRTFTYIFTIKAMSKL
jgi:hypothetical protein